MNNLNRIGILTHYYNSTNYGGMLQSYALCYYLSKKGLNCEQICYNSNKIKRSFLRKTLSVIKHILISVFKSFYIRANISIRKRKKSFVDFRNLIPHSSFIYNEFNIDRANNIYSSFITGSDQVWNPIVFRKCYSLGFSTKPKYSYAASMAVESVDKTTLKSYMELLSDYRSISVRERTAQKILSFRDDVKLVLDPTFLLSKEEWLKITSPKIIKEKYCFAYFLGSSLSARNEALKCAHSIGAKLVSIPFLNNSYRKCDSKFGDIRLSNIGPQDFLSLIYNAECIFTDSFHAICLSYIFKKDFYVFKRNARNDMNSRISDILLTLELENRYVSFIGEFEKINYSLPRTAFEDLYKKSFDYLETMILELKEK